MKKYLFVSFFVFFCSAVFAQKIVTLSPMVDEQSYDYVHIKKVELTDEYTIIHFKYIDKYNGLSEFELRQLAFMGKKPAEIEIDPKIRLYQPKNTSKKFKFIKAVGIPTAPEIMKPKLGQIVNFSVYFERLTPGIEIFDMFEGKDHAGKQFWNYYGVHIRNPKQKVIPKPKVDIATPKQDTAKEAPKPLPVVSTMVTVKGNIIDAKTQKPIAAKLSYVLPNDDNGFDSLTLSASSGKFKLNLEKGRSYGYAAAAKGYFPINGAFDLTKSTDGQEITNDIVLHSVAVGEAITLNNIYFEATKFDLLPTSYAQLDQLAKFMQDNPTAEIRVEGHTDNVGDFDENVALSLNRANAVKKYLVEKGLASARIEAKGYGPTRPVVQGSNPTNRQKNRRVEFVITKQ